MENYVGKRLDGRYELIEKIGEGGMAQVYKAFDNIDHRIVAVKILKEEFNANSEFKRRFMNESKAISVLSHPNIVKVYDVSYGEIIQYIVMEFVDGITLKKYIEQQKTLEVKEALYFAVQILRALQHAHDKGIVHRDIKPQNIMLTSDGTIKVTDFGIARFSRSETRTMTEGAIGSVHYISPEQAKGSLTDARTDLYSVGVILYEMLTGRLPFTSDNAVSVALMQLHNDPVKPREINPEIPLGLEQIIIRAMQKNPGERYQSASEILRDIIEFKNNPNIKFDYTYYSDVPKQEVKPSAPVEKPKREVSQKFKDEAFDESDDDTEDVSSKKKTITILSGILCALVVFSIALIVFFKPDSNKINVPNLVGKNFYSDVMNNASYSNFTIEPEIIEDSKEPAGTIIDQSPSRGKVSKGSTIIIYISDAASKLNVPDVYGYEYTSAEAVLKSKGFLTTVVKEKNEDIEPGSVIRTSPERDELVDANSLITIYVAISQDVEPIEIPELVGKTVAEARAELQKAGLVLNEAKTEYRASSKPVGIVIGHEYIGEKVLPGTSIALYVSSGRVPSTSEEEDTTKDKNENTTKDKDKNTTKAPSSNKVTTLPPVKDTTKPTAESTAPSVNDNTTAPTPPSENNTTEHVEQPSAEE